MTCNLAEELEEMTMEEIARLSGYQILKVAMEGRIKTPMAETMGHKLTKLEKGFVEFEIKADARHLGPFGAVHGGFGAATLDSVVSCAVISLLEPGVPQVVVDLNVKMVKAIPKDTVLKSEGKVLHLSRRIGMAEGKITDHAGTLYAHATATCMILR